MSPENWLPTLRPVALYQSRPKGPWRQASRPLAPGSPSRHRDNALGVGVGGSVVDGRILPSQFICVKIFSEFICGACKKKYAGG